jgi:hypothetical protein
LPLESRDAARKAKKQASWYWGNDEFGLIRTCSLDWRESGRIEGKPATEGTESRAGLGGCGETRPRNRARSNGCHPGFQKCNAPRFPERKCSAGFYCKHRRSQELWGGAASRISACASPSGGSWCYEGLSAPSPKLGADSRCIASVSVSPIHKHFGCRIEDTQTRREAANGFPQSRCKSSHKEEATIKPVKSLIMSYLPALLEYKTMGTCTSKSAANSQPKFLLLR